MPYPSRAEGVAEAAEDADERDDDHESYPPLQLVGVRVIHEQNQRNPQSPACDIDARDEHEGETQQRQPPNHTRAREAVESPEAENQSDARGDERRGRGAVDEEGGRGLVAGVTRRRVGTPPPSVPPPRRSDTSRGRRR